MDSWLSAAHLPLRHASRRLSTAAATPKKTRVVSQAQKERLATEAAMSEMTPQSVIERLRRFLVEREIGAEDLGGKAAHTAPVEFVPFILSHMRAFHPSDYLVVIAAYHKYPPSPAHSQVMTLPAKKGGSIDFVSYVTEHIIARLYHFTSPKSLVDAAEALASLPYVHGAFVEAYAVKVTEWCKRHRMKADDLIRALRTMAMFNVDTKDNYRIDACLRGLCHNLAHKPTLSVLPARAIVQILRDLAALQFAHGPLLTVIGNQLQPYLEGAPPDSSSEDESHQGKTRVRVPESERLRGGDWIDVLGSYATLKQSFHMLFKAVGRRMLYYVEDLSADEMIAMLHHYGAAEIHHDDIIQAAIELLPHKLAASHLSTARCLQLLQAFGRLRIRPTDVLRPLLGLLEGSLQHEASGDAVGESVQVLYEMCRLDVWEERVVAMLMNTVESVPVGVWQSCRTKTLINLLFALTYFSLGQPDLYMQLTKQLVHRENRLDHVALTQLKVFEMAARVGHLPLEYGDLPDGLLETLIRWRTAKTPPEERITSALQREVGRIAAGLHYHHYHEISLGPYTLDFVRAMTPHEEQEALKDIGVDPHPPDELPEGPYARPREHSANSMKHSWEEDLSDGGIIIEVDGPHHFYKNSYHWTSFSKLKHRLLSRLGFKVVHIPYFTWQTLRAKDEKYAYVRRLLEAAKMQMQLDMADMADTGVDYQPPPDVFWTNPHDVRRPRRPYQSGMSAPVDPLMVDWDGQRERERQKRDERGRGRGRGKGKGRLAMTAHKIARARLRGGEECLMDPCHAKAEVCGY